MMQPSPSQDWILLDENHFLENPSEAAQKVRTFLRENPGISVFFLASQGAIRPDLQALTFDCRQASFQSPAIPFSVFARSSVFRTRILAQEGLGHQLLALGGMEPLQLGVIYPLGEKPPSCASFPKPLFEGLDPESSPTPIELRNFPLKQITPPQSSTALFLNHVASKKYRTKKLKNLYTQFENWPRLRKTLVNVFRWMRSFGE